MTSFRYKAFTSDGRVESGTIEFATEGLAFASLTGQGLTVFELAAESAGSGGRVTPKVGDGRSRIPLSIQADLAEQMALMLGSGMTLPETVRLLQGSDNRQLRHSFDRINRLLADGTEFPEAFAQESGAFSPIFAPLVAVSYAARDPVVVLNALSAFLRKQDNLRAEIGAALVYPIILLSGAALMVIFLALYLAPNLAPMFASLGQEVPALISTMVTFGEFISGFWFVLLPLIAMLGFAAFYFRMRLAAPLRAMAFRLPKVGPAISGLSLSRLARTLSLFLGSGTPLAQSLQQTADLLQAEPAAKTFANAARRLETGARASDAFDADKSLPRAFCELFRYGETSNSLPAVMTSVAASFESRAERQMQALTRLIVPVLTFVVGGSIAAIVYLVMGAVLSVNDLGNV
jgi:general secretion pathway protein F